MTKYKYAQKVIYLKWTITALKHLSETMHETMYGCVIDHYNKTSRVYWCMASNFKAQQIYFWMKNSIYVCIYLFAIYVLCKCTEDGLSSSNCLDLDKGTMDSKTWFVHCNVWQMIIHMYESEYKLWILESMCGFLQISKEMLIEKWHVIVQVIYLGNGQFNHAYLSRKKWAMIFIYNAVKIMYKRIWGRHKSWKLKA